MVGPYQLIHSQLDFAALRLVFRIRHLDGEEEVVSFACKARRIRLAHKRLHSHDLFIAKNSASQFVVVRDHQKFPACERVGDCKCQRDIPICVRLEVWEEERRLLQVLSRRDFGTFVVSGRLACIGLHQHLPFDRSHRRLGAHGNVFAGLVFHHRTGESGTHHDITRTQRSLHPNVSVSRRNNFPRWPGEISRQTATREATVEAVQILRRVLQGRTHQIPLVRRKVVGESGRDVVPLVCIKRAVVHKGEDFRRTGHLELPRLLPAGIQFAREMLRLDVEVFAVPRDVERRTVRVEPVLAHERRLDPHLAAMLVLDGKFVVPGRRDCLIV